MKSSDICLVAICVLSSNGAAQAQVALKDQKQLTVALTTSSPCCVIDGRSAASRKQRRLTDALVYRADLRIMPTAAVVVIADHDADAVRIANAVAKRHPGKPIIAVKGGIETWQEASNAAALLALGVQNPGGRALSFVIPSNTCEQGKPLQELRSGVH